MKSQLKSKGSQRSYDFPADFKNLIGFCLALSQVVEQELDFWGCEERKMFSATNLGPPAPSW